MRTRKLTVLAMITALALILSYAESLLPSFGVPGVKLGLANAAVMFALFRYSWRETAAVSFVRCTAAALLFGSTVTLFYSLAGAAVSICAMAILKKTKLFSVAAISAAGGVMHNAGQTAAACVIMGTSSAAYYFPLLIASGTVTGLFIGLCSGFVIKRVPYK